jgi:D-lactate dehydrogenase
MSYTVAFFEAFDEEEKLLRKLLPKDMDCFFTRKTIQEADLDIPPAPIISIRTQSLIPSEWADQINALITRSTGYDHITAYCTETRKIINAAYLPDYAGRAVAEQAMLLWTALLRKLELQRESFDSFHRDEMTGRELIGRSLTVLGVGRIGSQIVDIGLGLKMNVVGVDIAPRKINKLKYMGLDEGIKCAEILVCALPLTDKTLGMLNYNLLKKLQPNAIFINIARGEISPAKDLLKLLEDGSLAGAALDVYDYEKELASVLRDGKAPDNIINDKAKESVDAILKMRRRNDVLLTPHNAFNTIESVKRKSKQTVDNLLVYLKTGNFLTPIP